MANEGVDRLLTRRSLQELKTHSAEIWITASQGIQGDREGKQSAKGNSNSKTRAIHMGVGKIGVLFAAPLALVSFYL